MNDAEPIAHDAAARVLALMLAARGWINDCELQALDEIDAFRRLGIDRDRFVNLAQAYAHDMGSHLGETSWLRDGDRAYVDSLLRQVTDPDERCLVCRLATAAMAAGGCDSQCAQRPLLLGAAARGSHGVRGH